MKSKKSIKKFENVKDIIYNSAKIFADKIAFTTKVKNGSEVAYINHTYSDLLKDINSFGVIPSSFANSYTFIRFLL